MASSVSYDSDTSDGSNALHTTTYTRDSSGDLTSSYINDGRPRTVTFTNDVSGQVIDRTEVSPAAYEPREIRYRFGGREMGMTGNNGDVAQMDYAHAAADRTITPDTGANGAFRHGSTSDDRVADFNNSFDPINSYAQGSRAGTYMARGGETFSALAASLYGDSALWYKLAQANPAIASPDVALSAGQTVRLPANVMRSSFNASIFAPYDPGEAIGDLSPTTPEQPKEGGQNCGVVGQILLTVVAVAVSAIVAPYLTAALGTVAGGAATGAVASTVSQGVGVATGIQDKFNWKSVGLAAISGGLSRGASAKFGGSTNFGQDLLRGSGVNALTQGLGVATGLQESFSWSGVAAAGIGSGVGAAAGRELGSGFGNGIGRDVAVGTASALANAATRSALDGSNFGDNIVAAIPDVIGGALGNAVGSAVGSTLASRADRTAVLGSSATTAQSGLAQSHALTQGVTYAPDEVTVTGVRVSGVSLEQARAFNLGAQRDAEVAQIVAGRHDAFWANHLGANRLASVAAVNRHADFNVAYDSLIGATAASRFGAIGSAEVAIGRHARAIAEPRLARLAYEEVVRATQDINRQIMVENYHGLATHMAQAQRPIAEGLSYIPVVGGGAAAAMAYQDYKNGDKISAIANVAGVIPGVKLVGLGSKFGARSTRLVANTVENRSALRSIHAQANTVLTAAKSGHKRFGDHVHHVLPIKGVGSRIDKLRVRVAQRVLIKNGINPGVDIDNLVFAARGRGVHGKVPQRELTEEIFKARDRGAGKLREILRDHRIIAREK
ncbi:hypothetical protein GCM10007853_04020 [Algimonas ampicilliniresistens]|uniref:LysM domain-containing protein n=1 Tax=Algimonas ampicilliniresistens TaxID=1298735 RepID=A0ABQ5V4X5_9PROT|nr:hypothetical protein GCM10007853_04020 [Algimonas ampicilliniresistens]